jgi:hypothetical protein
MVVLNQSGVKNESVIHGEQLCLKECKKYSPQNFPLQIILKRDVQI